MLPHKGARCRGHQLSPAACYQLARRSPRDPRPHAPCPCFSSASPSRRQGTVLPAPSHAPASHAAPLSPHPRDARPSPHVTTSTAPARAGYTVQHPTVCRHCMHTRERSSCSGVFDPGGLTVGTGNLATCEAAVPRRSRARRRPFTSRRRICAVHVLECAHRWRTRRGGQLVPYVSAKRHTKRGKLSRRSQSLPSWRLPKWWQRMIPGQTLLRVGRTADFWRHRYVQHTSTFLSGI